MSRDPRAESHTAEATGPGGLTASEAIPTAEVARYYLEHGATRLRRDHPGDWQEDLWRRIDELTKDDPLPEVAPMDTKDILDAIRGALMQVTTSAEDRHKLHREADRITHAASLGLPVD